MKTYIGTKIVRGRKMKLGDYNVYRGWQIPEDEDPEREGYLVRYEDDYESWSPKEAFERAYHETTGMMVFKEDCIARKNEDDTLAPYEVICADERVFVIAPISVNKHGTCTTDYERLEAYSNEESILSLEELHFIKLEK